MTQPDLHRRHILKTAGVSFGALTLGSSLAAGDSTQRFIVDSMSLRNEDDIEIIHDLNPVDLLVVRATEAQLNDWRAAFVSDIRMARSPYQSVRQESLEYPEEGDDLFRYQWDKHDQEIPDVHEITRGEGTRVGIIDSGIAAGHPDLDG